MSPKQWDRVRHLFDAALQMPHNQRAEFLKADCEDSGIRAEVESLLRCGSDFALLDRPAFPQARLALEDALSGKETPKPRSNLESSYLADTSATELKMQAMPAVLAGRTLGSYEMLGLLGEGGMGQVYLARDKRLDRKVAVKLLPARQCADPKRVWRFEREARAASALNHPNIITIYDIGVAEEGRYIVMEFVEGRTLLQILASSPMLASISAIGGQIVKALAVAHAAGIVHRDVKPANIMIRSDGYVKVLHFGIARLGLNSVHYEISSKTASGTVLGTVRYMSPEQARGEDSTHRSDVFSLGLVFYEMATGQHPFASDTLLGLLQAITSQDAPPPSKLNPNILPPLEALILSMLARDAALRPSAAEIDAALAVLDSPSSVAPAPGAYIHPSFLRSHNLPVQRTAFIGRQAERAVLLPVMSDPATRLITLTGPGGTGKTRLGIEIASEIAGSFTGGVCFVNLAPISDEKLVLSAIAQAAVIRESPGCLLPDTAHMELRKRGPMLLILDNFEQVTAAAHVVSELLDACPNVKALVTSRVVLRIYGEQEFPVPPLPTPEAGASFSPDRLLAYPSVALFVHRASAVKPDFRLTPQNAAIIAEICWRLDGLPLAIELAAARTKVLPPAALLNRIASRLDLLTGGARDLPERQRTLRNTIAWSYDLLTKAEQKLFRRLSAFSGGCTLEAAEAVGNAQEDLDADLLESITSLVDNSLIRQTSDGEDEPRFIMLETIREYGLERLRDASERSVTRRAQAAYCLVLAEEGMQAMAEQQQDAWLTRCDPELDNFRTAIEYLVTSNDAEWGLRLGTALLWFWESRELFIEGRAALSALLEMPGADVASIHYARVLFAAGVLADSQLDNAAADELTSRSLALHRQLKDRDGIATALNSLAFHASRRGHYAQAQSYLEEALQLWGELKSDKLMLALANVATIATKQGDYAAARATYQMILETFRSAGEIRGIASALHGLGGVAMAEGDYKSARIFYSESLAQFRHIGDRWEIGGLLRDLGNLSRAEGEISTADTAYREALTIFGALGHRRGIASVLELLACCASRQNLPNRALTLAGGAAALRQKLGRPASAAEQEDLIRNVFEAGPAFAHQTSAWRRGIAMTLNQVLEFAGTSDQLD